MLHQQPLKIRSRSRVIIKALLHRPYDSILLVCPVRLRCLGKLRLYRKDILRLVDAAIGCKQIILVIIRSIWLKYRAARKYTASGCVRRSFQLYINRGIYFLSIHLFLYDFSKRLFR